MRHSPAGTAARVADAHDRGAGAVRRLHACPGATRRERTAPRGSRRARRARACRRSSGAQPRGRNGPRGGQRSRGRTCAGTANSSSSSLVPGPAAQVDQLRAGGVAGLDQVPAPELGEQPGVDGSEAQISPACGLAVRVVGFSSQVARVRGEHRVQWQPADLPDVLARSLRPRAPVHVCHRSLVLPAQQRAERSAGRRSHSTDRLALRADARRRRHGTAAIPSSAMPHCVPDAVQISFASCSTHPGCG